LASFFCDDANLTVLAQNNFMPNPRTLYYADLLSLGLREDFGRFQVTTECSLNVP
jgi:hypothetical protein